MFVAIAVFAWIIIFITSIILMAGSAVTMVSGLMNGPKFLSDISVFLNKQFFGLKLLNIGEGTSFSKDFTTLIFPIIFAVIGFSLFCISISEFVRINRRQKISLPFTKIYLILLMITFLIFGSLLLIVTTICLFISLFFLEIILFDVEAINNYSEERNLKIIYKEEKKFEKEVNKDGFKSWKKRFGKWDPEKEIGKSKYKKSHFDDEKEW